MSCDDILSPMGTRRTGGRAWLVVSSVVVATLTLNLSGCVPWPAPLYFSGVESSALPTRDARPATGSSPHTTHSLPATSAPTPPSTPLAQGATEYLDILAGLSVDDAPDSHGGYDRDLFDVWIDANSDGCNTRAEVLKAQSVVTTTHHNRCTIDTGQWFSLYDGITLTHASEVDVDHVVPLSEAWKSGAWRWDEDTRRRFANDLGFSAALVAVSSHANRSKGDDDPAHWMPVTAAACDYAERWVAVKYRWSLTVDSAEKNALTATLGTCAVILWEIPPRATVVSTG